MPGTPQRSLISLICGRFEKNDQQITIYLCFKCQMKAVFRECRLSWPPGALFMEGNYVNLKETLSLLCTLTILHTYK